jgi:hypothetical protein
MATKKVVKKVKKALKPVVKKKVKPLLKKTVKPAAKKKAKPVAKKAERYACAVCGLVLAVDQACGYTHVHEFVCCDKIMKKK